MKINSTHQNYKDALDEVINTLPDKGMSGFTVERSKPTTTDVPPGTTYIYSIEDSNVDIAAVSKGDAGTDYVVLEYGNDVPGTTIGDILNGRPAE